jgi:hypothetical protein
MKNLAATNFLIAVAAASSKEAYDAVAASFTEKFEQLLAGYAQQHGPREIADDPFPDITRSLNDRVEETLTAKLDALRRELRAILEEASVIHRTRQEFFLRFQKSLQLAIDSDTKNGNICFPLKDYKYDIVIGVPSDVIIPEIDS